MIPSRAESIRIPGLPGFARIAKKGNPDNQVGLVSSSHIHPPSATFWEGLPFSTIDTVLDSVTRRDASKLHGLALFGVLFIPFRLILDIVILVHHAWNEAIQSPVRSVDRALTGEE